MIFEADFKNLKQNNHLQTSFTAGNAMRPRQRMRTLRRNRLDGKGFLARYPCQFKQAHAGTACSSINCSDSLPRQRLRDNL
jgi:hypothetical protein